MSGISLELRPHLQPREPALPARLSMYVQRCLEEHHLTSMTCRVNQVRMTCWLCLALVDLPGSQSWVCKHSWTEGLWTQVPETRFRDKWTNALLNDSSSIHLLHVPTQVLN